MGDILKVWDEENSIWIPIPAIQGAQGPKGDKGDTGDFSPLDAYPIGAFYISAVATSPAELFGGNWERIKGRFMLAAADNADIGTEPDDSVCYRIAGVTGGSERVTLTANQSGQRALTISGGGHSHTVQLNGGPLFQSGTNRRGYNNSGTEQYNASPGIASDTGTHSHTVAAQAASESHGNMPPYLAVFMWKRIA